VTPSPADFGNRLRNPELPLPHHGEGIAEPPGENLAEQLQRLAVKLSVVGQQVGRAEPVGRPSMSEERPRLHSPAECRRPCPGVEAELPEAVEAPASHVGKVEGR